MNPQPAATALPERGIAKAHPLKPRVTPEILG